MGCHVGGAKMTVSWHIDDSAAELAETLASKVHKQIEVCIAAQGSAVLALSGGSTPKPFFSALAKKPIDWSKLVVTLVDERWVDEQHELSNAAFMRRYLLSQLPRQINFVPLYQAAALPEHAFDEVLQNYCRLTNSDVQRPRKFDIVILGMGEDGHTASFFPDAPNINNLLTQGTANALASCLSKTSQVHRITWTLDKLLEAPFLALHITGVSKKQVLERALEPGSLTELPIRSVIFQNKTPLNIYYAD